MNNTDSIIARLMTLNEAGMKSRQELANKILEGGSYALEWAAEAASAISIGELAKMALEQKDPDKILITVHQIISTRKSMLLRNGYAPTSSGMFHNATNNAKAEAAVRFIEIFEDLIG